MARLKIKDAPLLTSIVGDEKIPTGGKGDFTLTPNQLASFIEDTVPFVSDSDLSVVENRLNVKINTIKTEVDSELEVISDDLAMLKLQFLALSKP